jgi:hypothetical protein
VGLADPEPLIVGLLNTSDPACPAAGSRTRAGDL